jgi:hypothetical protein
VYIPRRDSDSVATVLAGGRLFPGEHHRATFDVRETARDLHVAFASTDGTAHVSIDIRVAQRLQGSALFAGLQDASDFFRQGSAGFSATRDSGRLDGLELRAGRWAVEPAEVHAVCSSFFDDARLFPPGSATLDCALLMRDIPATWTAIQPTFPSATAPIQPASHQTPGREYREVYSGPWSRARTAKRANIAHSPLLAVPGPHFAHSVTIFASDMGWFVGPESVQSGRVMLLWLLRPASRGGHAGRARRPRPVGLS